MKTDALVSIVVPVYNVETFLERCVNSLIRQSYTNIEILLIDDGSTDGCPRLCDEFEKKDMRIKTFHRVNGGLAAARNTGIEHSKGVYITFVDSDDYVTKYHVENLVSAITLDNSDLAISMFVNVVDGDEDRINCGTNILLKYRTTDNVGCLSEMLYQRGIETSAPGKLYLKEEIGNLRFPEGKLYEDIMFTTKMIDRAKKVAIINNIDYMYYQRNNSIQYQHFSKQKMDCIWHSREMVEYIKEHHKSIENAAYVRYFGGLCNILFQIPKDSFYEERDLVWKDIKKYRMSVLQDKSARFKSKAAAILSFFGQRIMNSAYKKTQVRGQVRSRG